MPVDPYSSCLCGSGKKFKWCCASYFTQVEKAFDQDRLGQHEAALHTLQELTRTHADFPAVWGFYAQFLYNLGQAEKAEEALQEAFKRNPNFGMAHFLRGMFRNQEGEIIGALLLFRKAAENYDLEAHDQLSQVYELIFRIEHVLNRPVAARAALERVLHFLPGEAEVRQHFEGLYGAESPLPYVARKAYSLRPTAKAVPASAATGRFSDARLAYEKLITQTPDDPAAWFNLGLVLAWLGEQPRAVEALNQSIELETDDHRAEEAAALAEVLRCGYGMENDADYTDAVFHLAIRDPQPVTAFLQELERNRRLLGVRVNQETGDIFAMVIEELPSLLAVGSLALARIAAKLHIANGAIRLTHPNRESVMRVADEFRARLLMAIERPGESISPIQFSDVALEALAYPARNSELGGTEEKLREHARHYFEEVWLHAPRKSLSGVAPVDAVGSKVLRKKLFGAIKFLQDCFTTIVPKMRTGDRIVVVEMYDFNQLRHKIGLEYISAPPPHVNVPVDVPPPKPVAAPAPPAKREIAAMNAAELAGLDLSRISVEEIDQAMRAALKLDARDLAVSFAQAGIKKPFDPAKPDRYPFYACLITGALSEGDPTKAIDIASEGAKYDAEHNDGKRANEYNLRKGSLYAKQKKQDEAAAEFEAVIARHPDEGRYYTTAAEAMLTARSGAKAQHFAEKGLVKARSTNNRDLEGHCLELLDAAKRAM